MISIKRMLAGESFRYLLRTVADGEGAGHDTSSPMTRYYTEAGTPPGRWMGSGLAGLDGGSGLDNGSRVTGEQMARLFRDGHDPVNDDRLVRQAAATLSPADRTRLRVAALPPDLDPADRQRRVEEIEQDEAARPVHRVVAGFDLTFSPAKSVSVLWALADPATRDRIAAAHHAAISDVLGILERDVARTRVGARGVAQVMTRGLIAAAFDHYESRAGDPQLHTHVVIANRVQTEDGRWRTLDSHGALYPSIVAMSETYDALLADHLTRALGVDWETRGRPRKEKNRRWEIRGVSDDVIEKFSQRSAAIVDEADQLIDAWTTEHGRRPDDATVLRLRQQATLDTRPDKHLHSLHELTMQWRQRAASLVRGDARAWTSKIIKSHRVSAKHGGLSATDIETYASQVLERLNAERSTWRRWNIHAEAARVTMGLRVGSSAARDALLHDVVAAVEQRSLLLTAPALAHTPQRFRRPDGSSSFVAVNEHVFSSSTLLDAEDRLLAAGRSTRGPTVTADTLASAADRAVLGADQRAAVAAIGTSGRELDVLVGPAGTGKTTALLALRTAWETDHGDGSVIGLAASSSAAQVLGDALHINTENTAKWITEAASRARRVLLVAGLYESATAAERRGDHMYAARLHERARAVRTDAERWTLAPGQLVIVDEASLAGSLALDAIVAQAREARAKVVLVGDWAQLSAVDAGGAFGMVARDRSHAPHLGEVRRFANDWERDASARLRVGDEAVVATYAEHGRISDGTRDQVLDAAYDGWSADEAAGRRSLLITGDNATVLELNLRARADRVTAGDVEPGGVLLHDGSCAGTGDRIVTRRNERRLATTKGWVKNGDQFVVLGRHDTGALEVRRVTGGPALTLPASYVASDVELAYATTAHRAQGMTVDTAHAVITGPSMSREVLYVAMTRGRDENRAYVCTELADDDYDVTVEATPMTGAEVLVQVLRNAAAELSAHETIRLEQERVGSIGVLAAQYETIALQAGAERWNAIMQSTGITIVPDLAATDDYRGLVAAIRRADAIGLDAEATVPALARIAPLPDETENALGEVRVRVERWVAASDARPVGRRLIAGLVPAAIRITDPDAAAALNDRERLIEARSDELARRAVTSQSLWLRKLGPRPDDPVRGRVWDTSVATVAAYRERHDVHDPATPLGGAPGASWTRRNDYRRATNAVETAVRVSTRDATTSAAPPARQLPSPAVGR